MNAIQRGKVYSGDDQYDLLHLRHVRTTERTARGRTSDGYVVTVRTTTTVCDFARVTDRTVADPDAMIDRYEGYTKPTQLKPMQLRTVELIKRVAAALEDGPLTAAEIAHKLEESIPRIAGLIRYYQDVFDVVDRTTSYRYTMRAGWDEMEIASQPGAVNAAHMERSKQFHAEVQERISAYIREHGPSTVDDLVAVGECSKAILRKHLAKRNGTIYEREQVRMGKTRFYVWGLVGAD